MNTLPKKDISSDSKQQINPLAEAIKKSKKRKFPKVLFVVLLVLLVVSGLLGFVGYTTAMTLLKVKSLGMEAKALGMQSYDAIKNQNLIEADNKLTETKKKIEEAKGVYGTLSLYSKVPVIKNYYEDGLHGFNAALAGIDAGTITLKAIEPYADVLGFEGAGSFTGGTAEDRMKIALDTLSKITPELDKISEKVQILQSELGQIDEKRYPETFQGMEVRSQITKAKELSSGAEYALTQAKPILQVLPSIMGSNGKRMKYLVLFQNDKELRPTGGFMTAYATLFVEQGRITPEKSDDIYELDKKFKKKPAIPSILGRFLKTETQWNLRDMNISPDLKVSMDTFYENFKLLPGEPKDIDGIVTVDTHVLANLVKVLGPVEVPGYGTFTADTDKRCDCPQIIYALSEIVDRPTPYIRENRKGIMGPMMQSILSKAYGAPKQLWPELVSSVWANIEGKHVQMYFFDQTAQHAVEAINAAGRVKDTPENSDYLFVVDSNLGGAKSNLFINQEATLEVSVPENGFVTNTLTLTYKNPFPPSNCNLEAGQLCLNGTFQDWLRVYVPKGAKLVDVLGVDDKSSQVYEELNHTVLEGTFKLQPLNQTKLKFTYKVPYTDAKQYRVYIQKQGGTEDVPYLMSVNGGEEKINLNKDQSFSTSF